MPTNGLATSMLGRLIDRLTPRQVCWICVLLLAVAATAAPRVFARVDVVRELQNQVKEILVLQLEERAFALLVQACETSKQGRRAVEYRERLQGVLRAYKERTDSDLSLPQCAELGL